MEKNCIFCKIILGEIPAQIILQDEHIIVIKDIAPKAQTHYLIIPKKHIVNLIDLAPADIFFGSAIMLMAQKLAHQLPGQPAFRLVSNNGAQAGQSVDHWHFHFLAGQGLVGF